MMKIAFRSLLSSMLLLAAAVDLPTMPTNTTAPVCGDDEELFQLQMTIGHMYARPDPDRATYRIFTESTNETHDECIYCEYSRKSPADIKLCLPRAGCHTVLLGKPFRAYSCRNWYGGHELLVTWGDKTLRESNAWLFERIDFGDDCPTTPVCEKDNEILFEFFTERSGAQRDNLTLSWALIETVVGENGTQNEVALLEGHQAQDRESPFFYETACVPRNTCLEFQMWIPNPPERYRDSFTPTSVRLDGVIYSERQLDFDDYDGVFNRTIKLSKNCPVEIACNATSEDLFALEYEITRAPDDVCADNDSYESSSLVEEIHAPGFYLRENETWEFDDYIRSWTQREGFELNTTYAFLKCIPNDVCAVFHMDNNYSNNDFWLHNGDFWYKLFQNGAELTQSYSDPDQSGTDETLVGACAGAKPLSPGRKPLFSGVERATLVRGVVLSVFAVCAVLALIGANGKRRGSDVECRETEDIRCREECRQSKNDAALAMEIDA